MKKVGIALGSGSARGSSHLGILKVLEGEGIPIDIIAGSSVGGVVGGMYAAGELESFTDSIINFEWKHYSRFLDPVFPKVALFQGEKVFDFFSSFTGDKKIESLTKKFAAVTTDILTGKKITLSSGSLALAMKACIAIPGMFTPVKWDNKFLMDGGLTDPVPVSTAKKMGADIVIAVNLNSNTLNKWKKKKNQGKFNSFFESVSKSSYISENLKNVIKNELDLIKEKKELPGIFEIAFNAINIMEINITKERLKIFKPDIMIMPELGHIRLLDFHKAEECIREGEKSALQAVPAIKALLNK